MLQTNKHYQARLRMTNEKTHRKKSGKRNYLFLLMAEI